MPNRRWRSSTLPTGALRWSRRVGAEKCSTVWEGGMYGVKVTNDWNYFNARPGVEPAGMLVITPIALAQL